MNSNLDISALIFNFTATVFLCSIFARPAEKTWMASFGSVIRIFCAQKNSSSKVRYFIYGVIFFIRNIAKANAFTSMAGDRGRNVRGSVELSVVRPWFLKILAVGRVAAVCGSNMLDKKYEVLSL